MSTIILKNNELSNYISRDTTAWWFRNANIKPLLLFGLLSIILYSIYYPALNSPFLFDDTNNIEQNSNIHITDLSFHSLKKAATGSRPVAMLSFALTYYQHGLSPFWFRITNLLIHICTAMLLYLVLCHTVLLVFSKQDIQRYSWLPAISALIWAVHPLQIQSVTYIVQRMNSLSGLFFLLSLLLYIHARLSTHSIGKIVYSLSCILAALLAIGSKPNAAVLPIIIILYEWFFFQKRSWTWGRNHFLLIVAALLLVIGTGCYLMDGNPINKLDAWYAKNEFTPAQRVITEFRVIILYLSLLVFPHPECLNLDHDILLSTSLFAPVSTAYCLAAIISLIVAGLLTTSRYPLFAFGIFWFFINHLIESTIIPLDFIFEHRNYLPSMMLIASVVFLMMRFLQWKFVKIVLSILVIAIFSTWTYQRNIVWQSGITLWQDSANKSPNKPRPHESVAYYLEKEKRYSESLHHYQRAVQLNPNDANIHNNVGNIYMKTGELNAAVNHYQAALHILPNYKEAHNNIGNALSRLGKFDRAIVHYKKTLELDPNFGKVHANLGNTLAAQGKMQQAMQHYDLAIKLNPENIESQYNRSILLLRTNRFAEAELALKQVITRQKDFTAAHNNLGVARENLGKIKAAIQSYQQALHINPHFNDARKNLDRLQAN